MTPESERRLYWDFASASRLLLAAYDTQDCSLFNDPDGDGSTGSCYHENSIELLDWVQRKAWYEIRRNVFSTIGTLLNAELTEKVFTHALEAEGIQLETRLKEGRPDDGQGSVSTERFRTKERYKCERIENASSDETLLDHAGDSPGVWRNVQELDVDSDGDTLSSEDESNVEDDANEDQQ